MGIGFSFTASAPGQAAVRDAIGRVAREHGYESWNNGESARVEFCRLGDLFLDFPVCGSGSVLTGECQTNFAGAGFHAAAIAFTEALAAQLNLSLTLEDDTDYFHHRDFDRMRRDYFYPWLTQMISLCSEKIQMEADGSLRFGWPADQYQPAPLAGTVITPMGRLDPTVLSQRLAREGIEPFARDFFIWNEPEQDAWFFRNSALNLLWEECRFMPGSRSAEDQQINAQAISLLEQAIPGGVPFPKPEYTLLCTLNACPPLDVHALPDLLHTGEIGYRRGMITESLGNLTVPISGSFLFERSDTGDFLWYDGQQTNWHRVRMTAFCGTDAVEFDPSFFSGAATPPESVSLDPDVRCRAAFTGTLFEGDTAYFQLLAQVLSGEQDTRIILSFDQPESRAWAISFLHSLRSTQVP